MLCMASAMSEITVDMQHDEQACQGSMLGELSYSLSGVRKELHHCEEKWRQVFINRKRESSAFVVEFVSCVDSYTIVSLSTVILCN